MPLTSRKGRRSRCECVRQGARQKRAHPGLPKFSHVNKSVVRAAILDQLRAELALQVGAATMARDEATSEESRAENKWDTHSQEAAYLAEGQAKLAGEIGHSIELYSNLALPAFGPADAIAVGAVVTPESANQTTFYFIGPRAGGLELTVEGRRVLVLTPSSPLGGQLLGRRVGDSVRAVGRGAVKAQRIAAIE